MRCHKCRYSTGNNGEDSPGPLTNGHRTRLTEATTVEAHDGTTRPPWFALRTDRYLPKKQVVSEQNSRTRRIGGEQTEAAVLRNRVAA